MIYQDFTFPAPGAYEYGAYFRFTTQGPPSLDDFGSAGINVKISYGADIVNKATWVDINSNLATSWTDLGTGWWQSEWMLISGIFNVLPGSTGAQLNISLSAYEGLNSGFRVDDAYVQPVPEPATMLLLGTGLIGLVGIGRKKFYKK